MLLLGHRGCRGEFTENTFAAFDHAIECGCDGFEFDVRLSSDGIPVVWHDAQVRGRAIARHTFGSLRERCVGRAPTFAHCRFAAGYADLEGAPDGARAARGLNSAAWKRCSPATRRLAGWISS